jgi:hypothetical protein
MPRNRLAIELRPRSEPCRATARVLEGMNFDCRFRYQNRKSRPENLSDSIAQGFDLEWDCYRVVVAEVEFMFSRYHGEISYRLDEINLYTNPDLWARTEIIAPATVTRDAFFEFATGEEKQEIISLMTELDISCDLEKRIVVFDFAPGKPEVTWARIADGALLSQTQGDDLKSILFKGVGF